MPFPIKTLLENKAKLVTITTDGSVRTAFDLMIEFDYSQIPIVDEDDHPIGMVTHEGILRAILNFKSNINILHIRDVIVDVPTFYFEDDIFDLLNALKSKNAVLILDPGYCIYGIVTSYDTTEFFRQQSENLLRVEDIESNIKELIILAYMGSAHETEKIVR